MATLSFFEYLTTRRQKLETNMHPQNWQNESLPETITSGTTYEGVGAVGEGSPNGDKRRRSALSTNLGLII